MEVRNFYLDHELSYSLTPSPFSHPIPQHTKNSKKTESKKEDLHPIPKRMRQRNCKISKSGITTHKLPLKVIRIHTGVVTECKGLRRVIAHRRCGVWGLVEGGGGFGPWLRADCWGVGVGVCEEDFVGLEFLGYGGVEWDEREEVSTW